MSRCVSAGGSRLLRGNLTGSVRVGTSSQTLPPPVFLKRGGRGGVSNWCFLLHHQGAEKHPAEQGAYSMGELKTEADSRELHQSRPSLSLNRLSHTSAKFRLASTVCHISQVSPTWRNPAPMNVRRRQRLPQNARSAGGLRWGMDFRRFANVRRLMTSPPARVARCRRIPWSLMHGL